MSNSLTLAVQPSGQLVVKLYLGVGTVLRAEFMRNGQQPPLPLQITALVDTGASKTVIELGKLQTLGLTPVGETDVNTASTGATPLKGNLYRVELSLAESVTGTLATNHDVVAVDDLSGLRVEALLGRDILKNLHLSYNGPSGQFTIEFP